MPATTKHKCYRCAPHDAEDVAELEGKLEALETTRAEDGGDVFFTSGYSAREIAQRHAAEHHARVYVNNVSRRIKRRDLSVPVAYAVADSPVYTICPADEAHDSIHRVYWRPLD